jgi:hypothetical protein
MEDLIKEAGTLIGSIGTYARLVIVGVWFPGFLIFCELGSCYFRLFCSAEKTLFGYIAANIQSFNSSVVTTLIVVSVLATSIALGYVARDIAFAISDLWLRRQWRPTRKLSDIYEQIRMVYGGKKVDHIAAGYRVFRLVSATGGMDRLPRMPESYVREFCKQWLRVNAPALNTEGLEIEINMLMGLVVPMALFSTVVICFVGSWVGIALAVLSIAAAVFMMYRINWARNIETEQAIVNFLFAHWERLYHTRA